jgi:regulator of replication initiation timing
MDQNNNISQIDQLQKKIELLLIDLDNAKKRVRECVEASSQLSLNAAKARAKNQGEGRGLDGMLFGSKYRASVRRSAAKSNASISRQVAQKRANIASIKSNAQEKVRLFQMELSKTKEELRLLTKENRKQEIGARKLKKGIDKSLTLLEKLKEAHDLGLLTEEEFEVKRKKLIDEI